MKLSSPKAISTKNLESTQACEGPLDLIFGRVWGFRALGVKGPGLAVLGFRVLGFRVLRFKVQAQGFGV